MPPKRSRIEALPETCGSCRHAHDITGQTYLLCYAFPPLPVVTPDGEIEGQRGQAVEPTDPACAFFGQKGRA